MSEKKKQTQDKAVLEPAATSTNHSETKRSHVSVIKDEPTIALDAVALLLGLTLVALLFNTVAPMSYMVSILTPGCNSLVDCQRILLGAWIHTIWSAHKFPFHRGQRSFRSFVE